MAKLKLGEHEVLFDDIDFPLVAPHKWRVHKRNHTSYVLTTINDRTVHMPQVIMPNNNPLLVHDHIDSNGLNNTRANLRLITQAENCRRRKMSSKNQTGYKGVSYIASRDKYQATIEVNGKSINLGRFNTPENAAKAYQAAKFQYFGESK